jgi:hypothetical protein
MSLVAHTTPPQPDRLPSKTTFNVPLFDIATDGAIILLGNCGEADTTDLTLDEKTTAIGEGLAIAAFSFKIGALGRLRLQSIAWLKKKLSFGSGGKSNIPTESHSLNMRCYVFIGYPLSSRGRVDELPPTL